MKYPLLTCLGMVLFIAGLGAMALNGNPMFFWAITSVLFFPEFISALL